MSSDQTMERGISVGQKLMKARADCGGLSLENISEELCIRPHLLAALEQDDFNKFPSACYAAGFLKNYATYLGLNSGQIVAQYKTEYNGSTKKVDLVFLEPERRHDYAQQILVSLIILSALVLYGVWYFMGGQKNMSLAALPDMTEVASNIMVSVAKDEVSLPLAQDKSSPKQREKLQANIQVKPKPNTEKPIFETAASERRFQLIQQATAATVEPAEKTTAVVAEQVRLIAKEDSWVRIVDADQDILVDRILLAGEEFYATDQTGMKLMTSNAGAVSIYVGTVAVSPLGNAGEIRENISLDRQDLLMKTAQLSQ